jgi:hypothetical protein
MPSHSGRLAERAAAEARSGSSTGIFCDQSMPATQRFALSKPWMRIAPFKEGSGN